MAYCGTTVPFATIDIYKFVIRRSEPEPEPESECMQKAGSTVEVEVEMFKFFLFVVRVLRLIR